MKRILIGQIVARAFFFLCFVISTVEPYSCKKRVLLKSEVITNNSSLEALTVLKTENPKDKEKACCIFALQV